MIAGIVDSVVTDVALFVVGETRCQKLVVVGAVALVVVLAAVAFASRSMRRNHHNGR